MKPSRTKYHQITKEETSCNQQMTLARADGVEVYQSTEKTDVDGADDIYQQFDSGLTTCSLFFPKELDPPGKQEIFPESYGQPPAFFTWETAY